jgi:hypothetical protein
VPASCGKHDSTSLPTLLGQNYEFKVKFYIEKIQMYRVYNINVGNYISIQMFDCLIVTPLAIETEELAEVKYWERPKEKLVWDVNCTELSRSRGQCLALVTTR